MGIWLINQKLIESLGNNEISRTDTAFYFNPFMTEADII